MGHLVVVLEHALVWSGIRTVLRGHVALAVAGVVAAFAVAWITSTRRRRAR